MSKIDIRIERCKGCEYCVLVCPHKVLGVGKELNKRGVKPVVAVNSSSCTGCTLCAQICPDICIEIWK